MVLIRCLGTQHAPQSVAVAAVPTSPRSIYMIIRWLEVMEVVNPETMSLTHHQLRSVDAVVTIIQGVCVIYEMDAHKETATQCIRWREDGKEITRKMENFSLNMVD